ncbi:MAG: reverse transcriptase N-terminal domain-containing protein [Deltaproteobacteria bacterium]|nr:reverse transcriptase N-terminal domain-containing protein [Deltaproteobacteria bacterium]
MRNSSKKKVHASSHQKPSWKSIDWKTVERKVRKLQVRIAKAVREGRHRKISSLQWLLTHSFHAKLLAVKRVVTNKGSKTLGVDGVVWKTPKQRMQALHSLSLAPVAETTADLHSYGFREYRCCADAIEQCFVCLSRRRSARWVLEADVEVCFDRIDHEWMLNNILIDKKILEAWLKAGYIEKGRVYPTKAGTPQGGIASPTLANMTLDGLESAVCRLPDRADEELASFARPVHIGGSGHGLYHLSAGDGYVSQEGQLPLGEPDSPGRECIGHQ